MLNRCLIPLHAPEQRGGATITSCTPHTYINAAAVLYQQNMSGEAFGKCVY